MTDTVWTAGQAGDYSFNLHPDITTLGSAYLDLVEAYDWKSITILYQDNDSMMTLKQIFDHTSSIEPQDEFRIVVKQLEENDNGFRDVLKEVFFSESNLIVLDCEQKILADVLMQAQQVGLISTGYYFLLTSLDAHVVDLENYKYGGTNFTAFRLIDVDKSEVQNVIYGIVESIVDRVMTSLMFPSSSDVDTAAHGQHGRPCRQPRHHHRPHLRLRPRLRSGAQRTDRGSAGQTETPGVFRQDRLGPRQLSDQLHEDGRVHRSQRTYQGTTISLSVSRVRFIN